ncbi:MAG: DUF4365 domain-containing protein [Planctomycetota bacterium]
MAGMQRHPNHRTEDLSANLVERLFLEADWVCEWMRRQYGIDFYVYPVEGESVVRLELAIVQLKASQEPTGSHVCKNADGSVSIKVEIGHWREWRSMPGVPVLLIGVILDLGKAWWCHVAEHVQPNPGGDRNITVKIPADQTLDADNAFDEIRNAIRNARAMTLPAHQYLVLQDCRREAEEQVLRGLDLTGASGPQLEQVLRRAQAAALDTFLARERARQGGA